MEGHWPTPIPGKHWELGSERIVPVAFVKRRRKSRKTLLGCFTTHHTILCKQIEGNLFFVLQKSTSQAGMTHKKSNRGKNAEMLKKEKACVFLLIIIIIMRNTNGKAKSLFCFLSLEWDGEWDVFFVEHLDHLTAAGPDILTRPDKGRGQFLSLIYQVLFYLRTVLFCLSCFAHNI